MTFIGMSYAQTISLPKIEGEAGSAVEAAINVDQNVENVGSIDITLTYDAKLLTAKDVVNIVTGFTVLSNLNDAGKVIIGAFSADGLGKTVAAGAMFNVKFEVNADAKVSSVSNLTFEEVLFSDENGNEIAVKVENGEFKVKGNVPPIANAGVAEIAAEVGKEIQFDGSASKDEDGTITAFKWDFGDGEVGEGEKVAHAYAKAGEYIVTLTVTDDQGAIGTATVKVVAGNKPPVAVIAGDKELIAKSGETIEFDGSGSKDEDGTIESYNWDFGDGTSAAEAKTSHAYEKGGEFVVTLTVTDNKGDTGTATIKVTVILPEEKTTNNITFIGKITYLSGAPASGVEVTIINKTLNKNYGTTVTDGIGKYDINYDIRYLEPIFGQIAAKTGDKISVVVNGKERKTFVLEDLVSPFIFKDIDVTIPPAKVIVAGFVLDVEFALADDRDGLKVKAANLNKNIESIPVPILPRVPTKHGRYTAELAGEVAAEPGDEIVVTVSDANGNEVGRTSHICTFEDLASERIIVNVATIFQGPINGYKDTNNITFVGVVYEPDGVTPVPNAEIIVRNKTLDKTYGTRFTDDSGRYDVRYLEPIFGQIAAKTGDKISFIVNGIDEVTYTLKSRDLVTPFIMTMDIILTGPPKEIVIIEPKEPLRIYADGKNTVPIVFELRGEISSRPVTQWKDINITINPPVGSVSPVIEIGRGVYTTTYTVGTEEAEVIITIAAGEAKPVSLPPITLYIKILHLFGFEAPNINADSGAPMGTVMLNAYTSIRAVPDIDHVLYEISSDGGATWKELGTASTSKEVSPEQDPGIFQAAANKIASGEAKEVDFLKVYRKWTLEWDTTTVDDTITYHPDVAPEEDEGRDYTKDNNFPPGPYVVRTVPVDTNGVRLDENPDKPEAPLKTEVSVDNIDDVPPLTGTRIVDIRREEEVDIFSDNLLPADEVEVYARIKLTAKPAAKPATFEKTVLLIESEDGTFSKEYTLDENYFVEIDTWAEKIPNGRYIFQALAVDVSGNREVRDMAFAQKVTITNVIPPTLANISLVQVAGTPIPPITIDASINLRPVAGVSIFEATNAEAASAILLISNVPLNWNVPADINLNDPSIVMKIQGEPKASFTFVLDVTSLSDGQYYLSFIFRSGPPVMLKDLMNIATIVDNTEPVVTFVAPTPGSTLGFRPVFWVKYQGTGSEIYVVNFELKDESGNTVLTPGVAEGAIEGAGAAATYVKPSLSERGFSIDDAKLVYKVPENLKAGGYTATITVTDLARNVTKSEISFVVGQDTSPPIIMVTSPHGTVPVDVTISVSAMDDTGVASVSLKLDGADIPPENVQLVDGIATSKVTGLKAGEHQVEAVVIDTVGNKASAKWSFIVDITPPQISVVSPQGVIHKPEATIAVAVTDQSGIDNVLIKLNDVEVPDVVLVDGIATAKVSGLKNGEQQVSVEVTDKAGNKASVMWIFTVELDTTPPQITAVSPLGAIRASSAKIIVSATDESGIANVAIKLNGADVAGVQLADGVATVNVTNLALGAQQVEAVVTDGAGNVAKTAWSFTVELDTSPPQITVVSPQGTIYQNSATISATITDESGIKGTPIIRVDGAAKTVTFSNGVATTNVTGLTAGEHQVEVVATDNANNTASAKWSFTVKLDTTPPQITVASPQGTIYKDSATISVTITDESGIKGNPTIKVDGSSKTVTFSNGVATASATGLTSGEHTVEVTATDNANNTASAKWSFTVMLDTIPPAITVVSPLGTIRVEKPTISVAVSDDVSGVDSVDISLKDAAGKTVAGKVSSDKSSATFKPTSALKAGTYTATAEAKDKAGNSASAEWTFTVEFDLVPPVITIVSPQDGARIIEAKPTISASYSDNLAGVNEKSVKLEVDGQAVTAQATTSQVTYTPTTDLSLGRHAVKLEVADNDDNKASVTWSFIVEMDRAVIMNPRNYPNPFQGNTTIAFILTQQSQITIRIFDFSGRIVKTLKDNEVMEAGPYKISWDGKSEDGDDLARGVYFGLIIMKTELEPQRAVLKMALTR
jgi:PKD repeat protein